MSTERLTRDEFGLGLMAGLHARGVKTLNESRLSDMHAAFLEAFKVVEEGLGSENLAFLIITSKFYGTSSDVDIILQYWLRGWATKDAPGTIYRFMMGDILTEEYLSKLPGGRDLYLSAADAFLKRFRSY